MTVIGMQRLILAGCLLAAGTGQTLTALAQDEVQTTVIDRSLKDLGFDLREGARSRESAFLRFRRLVDHTKDAEDATEAITELQRASMAGNFSCPAWAAEIDRSDYKVDVAVQFRGHTAALQAAASHQRLERCYKHHVYAPTKEGEAGRLVIARGPEKKPIEAGLDDLPPAFAALADFIRAGATSSPPKHSFEVAPGGGFFVSIPAIGPVAPGEDQLSAFCAELKLPKGCVDAEAIDPLRDFPTAADPEGPIVAYEAKVAADVVTLRLSVPVALVARIGIDLTEIATLAAGIDGWGAEIKPRYFDDRPRGLQVRQSELIPMGLKPEIPRKIDLQNNEAIVSRIRQFWGSLLHVSEKSGEYDPIDKGLALVDSLKRDHQNRQIAIVDFLDRGDFRDEGQYNSLSAFGHEASKDVLAPGAGVEAWSNLDAQKIAGAENDALSHALFAANLIGATKSIKDSQNRSLLSGLAAGVPVAISSPQGLRDQFSDRNKTKPSIVAVVYDARKEPCVTAGRSLSNSEIFVPIVNDSPGSGGTRNPSSGDLEDRLANTLSNAKDTLLIMSTTQWDRRDQENECAFFDNRGQIADLRRSHQESAGFTGLHSCPPEGCSHHFPSYFYPASVAQEYAGCKGFHCTSYSPNVVIAGALGDAGGKAFAARADSTRMSYASDAKMLFAPGVNIVGPESETTGGVIDRTGIGVRSGTSFAGPVIAAVAALVRAKHGDNIKNYEMKRWLAATATVTSELRDAFEAGMTHGAVNLQRAVESDPQKFTVWKKGAPAPLIGREILIGENSRSTIKWSTMRGHQENSGGEQWTKALSLIHKQRDEFYLLRAASPRYDSQNLKINNSQQSEFVPLACTDPKNFPRDTYGCIRIEAADGTSEEVALFDVSHIIFPKRFWSSPG